jgi:NADPH:quinone reductase-like Zn-dependent oxidoreductase
MNKDDTNESLLILIGELLYKNQLLRESIASKDEVIELSQLAREAGAYVIGTRHAGRQFTFDFGAQESVDLDKDVWDDVGEVDLVLDVLDGDTANRSAGVTRAGGTLVTVADLTEVRPSGGLAIDFVVVSDRSQLSENVQRARKGGVPTNIDNVAILDDVVVAFNTTERVKDETTIRVRP